MKRNENYLEEVVLILLEYADNMPRYYRNQIAKNIEKQKELNKTIPVKCWRENKNIPLPTYAIDGDACCDLYAQSIEYDSVRDRYIVHTGLHVALDKDYELVIRPRSSNSKTEFYIPNSPCTIDEPYRGEIMIVFKARTNVCLVNIINNIRIAFDKITREDTIYTYDDVLNAIADNGNILNTQNSFPYKIGDRVAQCIIYKRPKIEWQEVESLEELGETERGNGGFGHTGK